MIYRAVCPCGLEYIGKTSREFRRRIGEHIRDIRLKNDKPIARHMRHFHPDNTLDIHFIGIDIVRRPERRGNWDVLILQREMEWIFRLDTVHPKGLNENINFNCFI